MKLMSACFLKFAMVISFKTTKTAKWNSKKRQISSQKQNDNSANWLPQNVHAQKRQLSPFQNILEMNLPNAIFPVYTWYDPTGQEIDYHSLEKYDIREEVEGQLKVKG